MRRNALLLVAVMLVQVALPLHAGAATTPPNGAGDWTISGGETAYLNTTDQALVQGSIHVRGSLIIDGGSLFVWGSSDGLRDVIVYNGGSLVIQNGGILSSYTSVCFDMEVANGASLEINNGRIQEACLISLESNNWSLKDVHFEDSILRVYPPSSPNTASNGTPSLNWTVDGVDFVNITRGPVVQLQQGGIGSWSNTAKSLPMAFNNFTVEVDMYDQGSNPTYHTVEIDWQLSTHFSNGHLIDQSYSNSTGYTRYKQFGSQTGGSSYALYPALFDFSTSSLGGPHSLTNVVANHSHEHAFLYSSSQIELSDVQIDNLLHPFGNGEHFNPRYSFTSENNMATAIIQSSNSIEMSNLTVINSAHIIDNNQFSGNRGADVECFVIKAEGIITAERLGISNSCRTETSYSQDQVFSWPSHGSDYLQNSYSYCDGLRPTQLTQNLHQLTTSGSGEINPDRGCRLHSAFVIHASSTLELHDVSILDSAFVNIHFQSSNSYGYSQRHGSGLAAVLFSEAGGEIENLGVTNSANASTTSVYLDSSSHRNAFSYILALEGGSTSVLYVNNSELNHSSVTPECSSSYWDAQHWYAAGVGTGTVIVRDTNISEITLSGSCSSHGDAGMAWLSSNGEFLRKWTIDVRVVDPDGVFTPNATVKAYENSIWLLGNKSTGPNGSLVSFEGTQYSLTRSANYSYTPHRVEVTMTNYSNSTTFNMTGPMNITVFDPTPDAFPGDITQDWDNDSDGYGDNISGNNPDHFPNDSTQWNDTDGDGWGDNQNGNNPDRLPNDATQWNDTDGDGYGDNQSGNNPDRLPNDATQWQDADGDGYGDNPNGNNPDAFTNDATQWADADGDGYGDNASGTNADAFPSDASQWADADGDGYGDNANGTNGDVFPLDATQHEDLDGDGLGDNQSGNNPDPYLGDSDNDGYNNSVDQFPWNPTQHEDLDNDGLGDNTSGTAADPYPNDTDNDGTNNSADPFPLDGTQDTDADGDGYGDNQSGNNPDPYLNDSDNDGTNNDEDDFPWNPSQTTDSDGDGWGDNQAGSPSDDFPFDPSQWRDSDGDGYGDNANGTNGDAFPYDNTQWADSDGDGYGDNPTGTLPDAYPNDPAQWADSDGDGHGDNYAYMLDASTGLRNQTGDAFPLDSSQWSDVDGDGYGDNQSGQNPDAYPYDATQWQDADGDRFPDNYSYTTNASTGLRDDQVGDAFPSDSTQWSDRDGDGHGDNPDGNNPDAFPTDPTQWADADGDGLGDNPDGNNPDPTPGDTDNDGVPDYQDAFPNEPTQWADSDGDGYGDNWGATAWTTLRPSGLPGRFVLNAVLPDYFPTVAAAHNDSDFDGYPDAWGLQDTGTNRAGLTLDACPLIFGNATSAGPGCPDGDGDGVADQNDPFPLDPSQWADRDGDGYGDEANGSFPDKFPDDASQWADLDGDGYGDNASADGHDAFPNDPTQWADSDGDGHGDNPNGTGADRFPDDATQWQDEDGDGLGDDPNGNNPDPYPYDGDNDAYPDEQDDCPSQAGNSTYDRSGCLDSDGDGVSDAVDLWPNDPSRSLDTDGDGVNDPDDAFPEDGTQWIDNDGDGLGDNPNGNNPDPHLDDTDNDGVINQNDAFPNDSTQAHDLDGDGLGDHRLGNNPDPYPNDTDNDGVPNPEDLYPLNPDQATDSDGDGWGDNALGVDGDQFPNDPSQCCDTDGDGWGDNPNGSMPDAFPLDPSQWMDADGDGYGDNPNGTNPDPYPNDTDNDGVPNGEDGWPEDPTKYLDGDGDGIEDGEENFLTARIPNTSTGAVMGLALTIGLLSAAGGYLIGTRSLGASQPKAMWGLEKEPLEDEKEDDEI